MGPVGEVVAACLERLRIDGRKLCFEFFENEKVEVVQRRWNRGRGTEEGVGVEESENLVEPGPEQEDQAQYRTQLYVVEKILPWREHSRALLILPFYKCKLKIWSL